MPDRSARASTLGTRARVRAEITDEIKVAARDQLAEVSAAALSLRAVAREVGMASSAVYRYFPSRDDLLTALIVDAFDAVGAAVEEANAACDRDHIAARWSAIGHAVRDWALSHPQEYALVYGSPVPGYAAPQDTVNPAARVSLVFMRLVADGVASGAIDTDDPIHTTRGLRSDLSRFREFAPGVPDGVMARGLLVWTQLFGAISYELFGHLHNLVDDLDALFALQLARAGAYLTRGVPA